MLVYSFYKVRSLFPRRLIFIKQSITRQTLKKIKEKVLLAKQASDFQDLLARQINLVANDNWRHCFVKADHRPRVI